MHTQYDQSLYTKSTNDRFTVDEIVLAGSYSHKIQYVKKYLDLKFRIKDLGKLRYFLGL